MSLSLDDLVEALYGEGPLLLHDSPKGSPRGVNASAVARAPAPPGKKAVEPAGSAYNARVLAAAGVAVVSPKAGGGAGGGDAAPAAPAHAAVDIGKLLKAFAKDRESYYELLALGDLNIDATEEDIRRAHRAIVVALHPDKVKERRAAAAAAGKGPGSDKDTERLHELYLAVQRAHDVLSNEDRRRAYDSKFEFDESIPKGSEKGDFFAVFGPVFKRNARFSVAQPVPLLGDANTPKADVDAFYMFWMNFDSWREFEGGDKDANEAEDRSDRRYILKQQKAEAAKLKKKEMERINTLVTLAYSRDPRLAKKGGKGGAGGDKKGGDKAAAAEKAAALKKRQPEEVKAMEAADAESVKLRRAFREREKKLAKRAARDLKLAGPAAAGVDEAAIDAALARPPPAPTAVELHALLFGPDKVADVPPSNKDAPPAPVAGGGEKLKAAIKA